MRVYIHRGAGFYIGSTVVVLAETKREARALIKEELKLMGLGEELDIQESYPVTASMVVLADNGDY